MPVEDADSTLKLLQSVFGPEIKECVEKNLYFPDAIISRYTVSEKWETLRNRAKIESLSQRA